VLAVVTKKNQVTIYLSDEVRDKIKAIADRERRSFSFVVEELLVQGLEAAETGDKGTDSRSISESA
jgi:predicted transcriptional regulator